MMKFRSSQAEGLKIDQIVGHIPMVIRMLSYHQVFDLLHHLNLGRCHRILVGGEVEWTFFGRSVQLYTIVKQLTSYVIEILGDCQAGDNGGSVCKREDMSYQVKR